MGYFQHRCRVQSPRRRQEMSLGAPCTSGAKASCQSRAIKEAYGDGREVWMRSDADVGLQLRWVARRCSLFSALEEDRGVRDVCGKRAESRVLPAPGFLFGPDRTRNGSGSARSSPLLRISGPTVAFPLSPHGSITEHTYTHLHTSIQTCQRSVKRPPARKQVMPGNDLECSLYLLKLTRSSQSARSTSSTTTSFPATVSLTMAMMCICNDRTKARVERTAGEERMRTSRRRGSSSSRRKVKVSFSHGRVEERRKASRLRSSLLACSSRASA